jgi:methionyl-tRNA formyltransferase
MRLVFMGTPEASVSSLRHCIDAGHEVAAVWTQPDKPAGRGNKLTISPVKEFALSRSLPVHQPSKLRNEETLTLFRSHFADVAIVVAYGRILPEPFLSTPEFGCVNVHFSLLPAYRGAAPVNWSIVRGEHETGVSTMMMDVGLDTGPVLLQRATPIGVRETAPELMERLAEIGAELLIDTLARLSKLKPIPQDEEKATFAPILERGDGLIEWALEAVQIERRVRGFQPWPAAFTLLHSKRLVIWSAEPLGEGDPSALPGEVIHSRGDVLIVAAGNQTALRVLELQPEGKRRMKVRDFLNGSHLEPGTRLG